MWALRAKDERQISRGDAGAQRNTMNMGCASRKTTNVKDISRAKAQRRKEKQDKCGRFARKTKDRSRAETQRRREKKEEISVSTAFVQRSDEKAEGVSPQR